MDMGPELAARIAFRFKALSDPARIRLLAQLHDGERRVGDLATATGLSPASTSKHLSWLKQAGVVAGRRSGNEVHYCIVDPTVLEICDLVCGGLQARHQALGRELGLADNG